MFPLNRLMIVLGLVLGMSGCASVEQPAQTAVSRHIVDRFSLEGRVAAYQDSQSVHGQLEWSHDEYHDRWTLLTPLGQIAAQLERTPEGVRLLTADGRQYQAPQFDALPEAVANVPVPLEYLARWVQAAPADPAQIRSLDEVGRPVVVVDQGWRIEYLEYQNNTPAALPRRLEVSRGAARLRLVIDYWETYP